ncbi:tetratricopeptide repeat protein, partial [Luminiphilus sp.]|nr:tetratricopeptide repeat protein [Luminiphilus sp.]
MEWTLDQALQQGVAAHKDGKLQDAERLYRAILQAQPQHPDANHNLGVLAVAADKPLEAIPLFKLALDANPKIEQFWLSYIDVLIKLERFDEAKRVIVEGKESGASSDKLDALLQRLQGGVPNDTNKTAKGQTLSERRKKLAERKKSKKRKTQGASSSAEPSQDQLNHFLGHYQAGRLEEAEALATLFTQQFPQHPVGWKGLGIVLKQTGRLEESLAPMQSAVTLSPQDAEAHKNLGITLQELGRLDEAEASCGQAIMLKPDFAEAHYNLGVTRIELGRIDEAEASYRQAIALRPDYAEAHYNLGITLKELGRLDEAAASYRQAIVLKPDFADAHKNLGNTLKKLGRLDEAEESYRQAIAFNPEDSSAKHLLAALSGNTTESAPLDYVESLFDKYASKFEGALIDNLEYKIPKVISEIILRDCNFDLLGSVIDLGCGTGLLGAEIKQFCRRLEGLDLSQKMLDEAKKKSIYDELIKQDILGYLATANLNFDYFIATDVFVYVGDLNDVFHLIKSRKKTDGKLVFSTENYDGDGFFLEQSGRYSHSKMY